MGFFSENGQRYVKYYNKDSKFEGVLLVVESGKKKAEKNSKMVKKGGFLPFGMKTAVFKQKAIKVEYSEFKKNWKKMERKSFTGDML